MSRRALYIVPAVSLSSARQDGELRSSWLPTIRTCSGRSVLRRCRFHLVILLRRRRRRVRPAMIILVAVLVLAVATAGILVTRGFVAARHVVHPTLLTATTTTTTQQRSADDNDHSLRRQFNLSSLLWPVPLELRQRGISLSAVYQVPEPRIIAPNPTTQMCSCDNPHCPQIVEPGPLSNRTRWVSCSSPNCSGSTAA